MREREGERERRKRGERGREEREGGKREEEEDEAGRDVEMGVLQHRGNRRVEGQEGERA